MNIFEEWLINGGPMPGLDLPEVPMPDKVTVCRCLCHLKETLEPVCYDCQRNCYEFTI